jgi:hypothetical protein
MRSFVKGFLNTHLLFPGKGWFSGQLLTVAGWDDYSTWGIAAFAL